jgi:hypothetical protein
MLGFGIKSFCTLSITEDIQLSINMFEDKTKHNSPLNFQAVIYLRINCLSSIVNKSI